jgi:hypothetical protein
MRFGNSYNQLRVKKEELRIEEHVTSLSEVCVNEGHSSGRKMPKIFFKN